MRQTLPGLQAGHRPVPHFQGIEQVMLRRPLHRVLAFTGFSIDDIINNPVARNHVRGFWKLHKQVERGCQIVELERQWR